MASSSTSTASSATTVVGVFDNRNEAEQARQELVQAGFRQEDVRLIPQQATTTTTTTARTENRDEGIWEGIKDFFGFSDDEDTSYYREAARRGSTMLQVTASSEAHVDRVVEIFQRYKAIDLDSRAEQWRSEGWTGHQATQRTQATPAASTGTRQAKAGEQASIPVVEEQLQVGKRAVRRGGVRIHTHVTERPVEAQVNLREEHVRVERHAVNRPASEADFTAAAGRQGTIEVTETAEVPVVGKQARVVEEVVVGKEATERTEKVRDTVRKTDVEVEQIEKTERTSSTSKSNPNQPGRSGNPSKDRV